MIKKIVLLVCVLSFLLVVSRTKQNVTLGDIQKQTQEVSEEGYILTSKVFVPEGTYLGKVGGEYGDHIETMYVKKNKVRVDVIYNTYEIRMYTYVKNNNVVTSACNNKEGYWICNEILSIPKVKDTKALEKLDEQLFNQLKSLPDKQVIGLSAKCFEIVAGSVLCYHPEYLIPLYEQRSKGFTSQATSLQFTTPNDALFILPA